MNEFKNNMKKLKEIYNKICIALKRQYIFRLAVSLRNVDCEYIYFITDTIIGTYPENFYFIVGKVDDDVVKYFEKFNDDNFKIEFNTEIGRLHRKNNMCEEHYYIIGKILINELKHKTGQSMYDVCYELFDKNIRTSRN